MFSDFCKFRKPPFALAASFLCHIFNVNSLNFNLLLKCYNVKRFSLCSCAVVKLPNSKFPAVLSRQLRGLRPRLAPIRRHIRSARRRAWPRLPRSGAPVRVAPHDSSRLGASRLSARPVQEIGRAGPAFQLDVEVVFRAYDLHVELFASFTWMPSVIAFSSETPWCGPCRRSPT